MNIPTSLNWYQGGTIACNGPPVLAINPGSPTSCILFQFDDLGLPIGAQWSAANATQFYTEIQNAASYAVDLMNSIGENQMTVAILDNGRPPAPITYTTSAGIPLGKQSVSSLCSNSPSMTLPIIASTSLGSTSFMQVLPVSDACAPTVQIIINMVSAYLNLAGAGYSGGNEGNNNEPFCQNSSSSTCGQYFCQCC